MLLLGILPFSPPLCSGEPDERTHPFILACLEIPNSQFIAIMELELTEVPSCLVTGIGKGLPTCLLSPDKWYSFQQACYHLQNYCEHTLCVQRAQHLISRRMQDKFVFIFFPPKHKILSDSICISFCCVSATCCWQKQVILALGE